jgi:Mg2+-importing ATPase
LKKRSFLFWLCSSAGHALLFGLEVYQEYHGEKAAALLREYLVVHTRVRRSGVVVTLPSEQIVPGDIVLIKAGDRLPADMRFIVAYGLELDESIMTGESVAVHKISTAQAAAPKEMYEAKNVGFGGTIVTAGRGEGIVFATGKATALGDIVSLTTENKHETGFEKNITQFSRFILKFVLLTLTIIFLANVFIKGSSINTAELLIFSLVLAVSVIPEALPVIVTVALSRGALRLAGKKVIMKRLSAIEDLGSIEVLCTDKTGTLTENKLTVSAVHAHDTHLCLRLATVAALEAPTEQGMLHDAFDTALWQKLDTASRTTVEHTKRIDGIPFDPERRRSSVLVEGAQGEREIIIRGAPEEILHLSRNVDTFAFKENMEWVKARGTAGERVLAVARRTLAPNQKYTLYEEQHLEFIGLVAFADPLKDTAKETLRRAEALHVEVKILTGDSKEVAGAVGCAVGLLYRPQEVVTGQDLREMTFEKKRETIFSHAVFARVSPREKYEIIKILQEKHEVGFLGEGINDAPALRLADVGLVVRGASDVARGAADVVLLEKSLRTVVDGIKEGRAIFANILKYLKITLTANFGNFYSVALASLFLPFVPLLPVQMLLLDLLADFPMIAIATDSVDTEELAEPRNYHVHSIVLMTMILGVVNSSFDFILFGKFYNVSPATLQTSWFLFNIVTEVILIYSLRTKRPFFRSKRPPWLLVVLSLSVIAFACLLPLTLSGQNIFLFIHPTMTMFWTILLLAGGYFLMTEVVKHFYFEHFHDAALTKKARLARKRHTALRV